MDGADVEKAATFWALLEGITHDAFMISTGVFAALTLFVVGLALYRLVPRRPENRIAPPSHEVTWP